MTINDMIKKFNLKVEVHNGSEAIRVTGNKPGKQEIDFIKANKQEIIAELKKRAAEEQSAHEARQAKINEIEGLQELRNAITDHQMYSHKFNQMMENEYNDGAKYPTEPKASITDLRQKYPRAAAYLKAESWSYASNYAKASAGKKALERIINGDDYIQVLQDMENEWSEHCNKNMWD